MTTQLDATTQSLREELLAGNFDESGKLREQMLAASLGVSRTVVRLALGELEKEGLVTREPNKGYQIRRFTLEEVTSAILVRGELEGMAARLCAERGLSDESLKELRSLLLQLDTLLANGVTTLEDRIRWIDLNAQFHMAIVICSGNSILADTIASLSKIPLVSYRAIVFDTHDNGQNQSRLTGAQRDHRDVVDAISQRQSGRAEHLMQEHARKSSENKRLSFDAMQNAKHSPAIPGLALVKS